MAPICTIVTQPARAYIVHTVSWSERDFSWSVDTIYFRWKVPPNEKREK